MTPAFEAETIISYMIRTKGKSNHVGYQHWMRELYTLHTLRRVEAVWQSSWYKPEIHPFCNIAGRTFFHL